MRLHLVRHGRPILDPAVPAARWELDPAGFDAIWALRDSGLLAARATWVSSPEPKALGTAQLLTDGEVGVVEDLREHERAAGWIEDFEATVGRAVAAPDRPAVPGWEPVADCRRRVVSACGRVLAAHGPDDDVVLVGHGTAWTLLRAELTGEEPDLAAWRVLAMPGVWTLDLAS